MMKKFVIVKHLGGDGKFLFRVPMDIFLEAGDKVVCDTIRGNDQLGVCCCDSFVADPQLVCPLFGVNENYLKYVSGKIEYDLFTDAIEKEKMREEENG